MSESEAIQGFGYKVWRTKVSEAPVHREWWSFKLDGGMAFGVNLPSREEAEAAARAAVAAEDAWVVRNGLLDS